MSDDEYFDDDDDYLFLDDLSYNEAVSKEIIIQLFIC